METPIPKFYFKSKVLVALYNIYKGDMSDL